MSLLVVVPSLLLECFSVEVPILCMMRDRDGLYLDCFGTVWSCLFWWCDVYALNRYDAALWLY